MSISRVDKAREDLIQERKQYQAGLDKVMKQMKRRTGILDSRIATVKVDRVSTRDSKKLAG